jgi:ADP-ribosyl-[dinitrogen reductase] hydrolase
LERARGAYLGLAVGDALGASVEFLTPNEIRHTFFRQGGIHKEIIGGGWLHLRPGQVTDDTTMSLALGEAILTHQDAVDALACAQAFDAWMRAKPIDIGNTVRRNLMRFRHTGIPVAPESEHDAGNGAVMRALPVALATWGKGEAALAALFRAQAHVTHHNALSDAGGLCFLRLIQAALSDSAWGALKAEATALSGACPEYAWNTLHRQENPSGYIVHTVNTVFQAFFATSSFESCLIDVVNRGGDADTTGAIAGALAGAWYGEAEIPARWKNALEKPITQRVTQQAERLLGVTTGHFEHPMT